MTVLRSAMLGREGFEHGFGTSRTAPEDFPDGIYILSQVHGERVVVLTVQAGESFKLSDDGCQVRSPGSGNRPWEEKTGGADIKVTSLPTAPCRFDEGDAMASDIPGVTMGIRTADCLPVLIADRVKGTAAAVHCGWRSLALGLAGKTVRVLTGMMGSDVTHLLAAMGPSIGVCCYEVGMDVREAFPESRRGEGLFEKRGGKLHLDLASGVKTQLIMEGMAPENIDEIAGCTACNRELFWSWRARKDEGRMVSFITVREPYL